MAELFEAVIRTFFALLELIFEALCFLAARSVTLIAYFFSKSFRARKKAEWEGSTASKITHLGFSGASLGALVAIPAWLAVRAPSHAPKPGTPVRVLAIRQAQKGEDARLTLSATTKAGNTDKITIAVKEGGLGRILATKTVKELEAQLKENVVPIDDQKMDQK